MHAYLHTRSPAGRHCSRWATKAPCAFATRSQARPSASSRSARLLGSHRGGASTSVGLQLVAWIPKGTLTYKYGAWICAPNQQHGARVTKPSKRTVVNYHFHFGSTPLPPSRSHLRLPWRPALSVPLCRRPRTRRAAWLSPRRATCSPLVIPRAILRRSANPTALRRQQHSHLT